MDARTLKSNFSLDESTSPELKLGQPLEVLVDAYPGRSFPARISAIDPLIGKSRTVQVQALLDNPEACSPPACSPASGSRAKPTRRR